MVDPLSFLANRSQALQGYLFTWLGWKPQGKASPQEADRATPLSTPLRQHRDERQIFHLPVFFIYLAALLITDVTLVVIPYAFSDDYPALSAAIHHNLAAEVQSRVAGGRPILAALFFLAFSHIHSVNDLGVLRLGGVVTLAVLAWMIFWALLRAGWEPRRAFPIPLIVCALPSLQIYAAWAIAVFALLAMVLGGGGALLVEWAYDSFERATTKPFQRALLLVAAMCCLFCALMIDQPGAMVYWVFAGISLLVRHRSIAQMIKRFLTYVGVSFVAMAAEYLVVRFSFNWLYGHPNTLSRTALAGVADIPYKAVWFIIRPITDSLNFYNIQYQVGNLINDGDIAKVVGVFIICGFFLYVGGSFANMLVKGIAAFCLLVLAYLPNLLVAESWAAYRTQCALGGLLTLYLALAFYGLSDRFGSMKYRVVAPIFLLGFAVIGMLSAATNVTTGIAEASYIELRVAVTQAQQQRGALASASKIYFIPNELSDSVASVVRYDEYGCPSASKPWTPAGLTYLAIAEVEPSRADLPVVILQGNAAPPPGSVVIDMRRLHDFGIQPLP